MQFHTQTDIVKNLLGKKNINVNSKELGRMTPLHMTVYLGKTNIVRNLLKHKDIDIEIRW